MNDIGYNIEGISYEDSDMFDETIDRTIGKFYIKDARTKVDRNGQKIITNQNFIEKYNVKTVFGFGAGYIGSATSVVLVIFSRRILEKRHIGSYSKYLLKFTWETRKLESDNKVFTKNIKDISTSSYILYHFE
ncbi:MAG: hypothetical protein GY749_40970 [Desulfobacteraceae bacterium]|nr:hypothetical protein [Desulfobacteraceae bacterium]